jgi:hypothetical protein
MDCSQMEPQILTRRERQRTRRHLEKVPIRSVGPERSRSHVGSGTRLNRRKRPCVGWGDAAFCAWLLPFRRQFRRPHPSIEAIPAWTWNQHREGPHPHEGRAAVRPRASRS